MADPRALIGWVRRATLLAVVGGVLYAVSRFELLEMPEDRCSPLLAIAPGTTLVVDLRAKVVEVGDVVFHEGDGGELWVGRVEALRAGGLWIVTDAPSCPVADSRTLGEVAPERLRGRVVFGGSW
ncbi:MAG: hypothetical protein QF903_00835 [Planctomycetota bacterium]|nr:hypothetical protein [Planctomycetota bacterium]MDP6764038.1 hypothetical protein [Planctomycetota bacterium]MDP6988006.1 hypothetical protein [Planctomycetota bacterium]